MASDLSELIQNGLSGTLESLLAKETKLEQTTKAHDADLQGQCVKVTTKFKFENLESSWTFFIPALGATYILNLMMGEEDSPASEEVDADTLDALNEVVSNVCGGLSTAINASGFEDLGAVQFTLEGNETVNGADFATIENLFRFVILLEDKEVIVFIAFDETIMPYLEVIAASEITIQPEIIEEEVIEEVPEEIEEVKEEIKEEVTEEPKEEKKSEQSPTEENVDESTQEEKVSKLAFLKKLNFFKVDESLSEDEKKQAKLKKIIIIVGALFGIVILTGIILYFTGAFEPEIIEEQKDTNTTVTKSEKLVTIKVEPVKKYIDFKTSQINIKRLNKKLSLLTKYEILEEDAIERLKAIEKEKLYKEKQAKLELFAKKNKEEPLFQKFDKNKKVTHKNKFIENGIKSDTNTSQTLTNKTIVFNSFVQIPTLQLQKFQKFIKKAKKVSANLSICKDDNGRTQIFIGPFLDKKSRSNVLKSLSKKLLKSTINLDLSQKDFDKMCRF